MSQRRVHSSHVSGVSDLCFLETLLSEVCVLYRWMDVRIDNKASSVMLLKNSPDLGELYSEGLATGFN